MKKVLAILGLTLALSAPAFAQGKEDGWYIKAHSPGFPSGEGDTLYMGIYSSEKGCNASPYFATSGTGHCVHLSISQGGDWWRRYSPSGGNNFDYSGPYLSEKSCLSHEAGDASFAVLCADSHVGYSHPIGGAIAYRGKISPSGVGYDIGCGNRASKTNLKASDIPVSDTMDEIVRIISFGIGRANQESVEHPVLDKIREANFAPQRTLLDLAANQLGTVGSGNHYVDLLADEEESLWVGVHFGSRGFGARHCIGAVGTSRKPLPFPFGNLA